jgi:ketosteroid isomerase-like protein
MDNTGLVKKYWDCMGAGRFDEAGACMAQDAVVWLPNTGEVFRGKNAFVAFNRAYPGRWSISVEKTLPAGDTVVTATRVESEDKSVSFYAVSFFAIEGGTIREITEYWGENAGPPEWRIRGGLSERYETGG